MIATEALSQLAACLRLVEAAAGDIDSRPVPGGEGWRANMALEADPQWTSGGSPAIGVRLDSIAFRLKHSLSF
ncbi:MAG: hypothetical protein ACK5SX_02905 [Sandaracinobacter sp.]